MTDARTGANFVDCPGFEDNRGFCVEVSTTYYMKELTRHLKQAKVLLLTHHFSVKKAKDRRGLLTMLQHAARILQDVNKFKDSLALVVTKVNEWIKVKGEYKPKPDDVVKEAVAAFLRDDVLPYLNEQLDATPAEHQGELNRAIQIIEVVINKDGG